MLVIKVHAKFNIYIYIYAGRIHNHNLKTCKILENYMLFKKHNKNYGNPMHNQN